MTDIVIPSRLVEQLEWIAETRSQKTEAIVEEALQNYLRQIEREKIQREAEAFREMYEELRNKHFGDYVAIHEGRVVDFDKDFVALHTRIRERYGRRPVLIRRVESTPERDLIFRSPRFERA